MEGFQWEMLVQLNFEWWVGFNTQKTDENTLKAEGAMLADALEWHVLLP